MRDLLWSKPVQALAEILHNEMEKGNNELICSLEYYATNEAMYGPKFRKALQKLLALREGEAADVDPKIGKKILKACELYGMSNVIYASLTLCHYGFYKEDLIENAEIPFDFVMNVAMMRAAARLNEGFLWHTGSSPLHSLIAMSESDNEDERRANFWALYSTLSKGLKPHEEDELFRLYRIWCDHDHDVEQSKKRFKLMCEKLYGDFTDYEFGRLKILVGKYGEREVGRALLWHAYWLYKKATKHPMFNIPKVKDLLWSSQVQMLAEMLHEELKKENGGFFGAFEHYSANEEITVEKFKETLQKLINSYEECTGNVDEKIYKEILSAYILYGLDMVVYATLILYFYNFYKKELIENADIPKELADDDVMRRAAVKLNESFLWYSGISQLTYLVYMIEKEKEVIRIISFERLCSDISRGLEAHDVRWIFNELYRKLCDYDPDENKARERFEALCIKLYDKFEDYEVKRLHDLGQKYGVFEFGRALLWHAYKQR